MPKRKTCFNLSWCQEHRFIGKSHRGELYAFCKLCRIDIDVSSRGKGAIDRHASTDRHRENASSAGQSSLSSFFAPQTSNPITDQTTAAELTKVYHTIKHHQSYRSLDCSTKVDRQVYSDSAVAKGVTLGRTKAQALCSNVLAPYSTRTHLDYIKEHDLPFSLASDASNKGAIKCFPIVLRYFHSELGVQHVLMDFYNDNDETSAAIANQIMAKLESAGLDISKVSAYTADNASVNYGKHNSVFQKLKDASEGIRSANCLAHLLHNTSKFATAKMSVDVENVVLKIYSHFSTSATRTAHLQEFCEFLEMDQCNIVRHVMTRWLSLLPSVDKIVKYWAPLSSYFKSLGEDACPKVLWECFGDEQSLHELYFFFFSHVLVLFTECIQALEGKSFCITSVYNLMKNVQSQLERRQRDGYFGFSVNNKLKELTPYQNKRCKDELLVVYDRALKYLQERYDFSKESFHSKVSMLGLKQAVPFEQFSEAVRACKLDVDMDGLYEEYSFVEKFVNSSAEEDWSTEERYLKLFSQKDVSLKNLKSVSAYLLSIPCSNAHTERVFSIMTSAWRNERNRLEVDTVKAELQVCVNLQEECSEVYPTFLANKPLLEAARKGLKYKKA